MLCFDQHCILIDPQVFGQNGEKSQSLLFALSYFPVMIAQIGGYCLTDNGIEYHCQSSIYYKNELHVLFISLQKMDGTHQMINLFIIYITKIIQLCSVCSSPHGCALVSQAILFSWRLKGVACATTMTRQLAKLITLFTSGDTLSLSSGLLSPIALTNDSLAPLASTASSRLLLVNRWRSFEEKCPSGVWPPEAPDE